MQEHLATLLLRHHLNQPPPEYTPDPTAWDTPAPASEHDRTGPGDDSAHEDDIDHDDSADSDSTDDDGELEPPF